jgi:hypothetical protein
MKRIIIALLFLSSWNFSQTIQSKLESLLSGLPLPKFNLTYDELKDKNSGTYQDEKTPFSTKLEQTESLKEEIENESENARNKRGSPQTSLILGKRNASGDILKFSQMSEAFSQRIISLTRNLERTNKGIIDKGDLNIKKCGDIGEGTKNVNQIAECQKKEAKDRDMFAVDSTNSVLNKVKQEWNTYLTAITKYYKTLTDEVKEIARIDSNARFEINWFQKQMIETFTNILKVIGNMHELRESTIIAFNYL